MRCPSTMQRPVAMHQLGKRACAAIVQGCYRPVVASPVQATFTSRRASTVCGDGSPAAADLTGQSSSPRHRGAGSDKAATAQPVLESRQQPAPAVGRVSLIMGPMFAGKSTELLRRVRQEHQSGHTTVLVKSSVDTRYTVDYVRTHTGDQLPCLAVDRLMPLLQDAAVMSHDVIAVDEAQFFPDLADFVVAAAEQHHKCLLIAGLDGDFRRSKFGQMLDLVPLADTVTKLNGKCNYCDSPSIHTFRVVADERQALVGGGDMYVPTCRHHYVSLMQHRIDAKQPVDLE